MTTYPQVPPSPADGAPLNFPPAEGSAYPFAPVDQFPHPAPQSSKTNTLAIVAFVTGLLGIAIAAVPTGIISLTQIKRSGEKGKGLAVAGLVLTAVWILISILFVVMGTAAQVAAEGSPSGTDDVVATDVPVNTDAALTASDQAYLEGLKQALATQNMTLPLTDEEAVVFAKDAVAAYAEGSTFDDIVLPLYTSLMDDYGLSESDASLTTGTIVGSTFGAYDSANLDALYAWLDTP